MKVVITSPRQVTETAKEVFVPLYMIIREMGYGDELVRSIKDRSSS